MSKTNCINCGAAKDTSEIRCPFCGTTYLDFTAIDFTSNDPVVCQFVLPWSKNRVIMSMLAMPRLGTMEVTNDTVTVTGSGGAPLCYANTGTHMNMNIEFEPIVKPGSKELFSLRVEE